MTAQRRMTPARLASMDNLRAIEDCHKVQAEARLRRLVADLAYKRRGGV